MQDGKINQQTNRTKLENSGSDLKPYGYYSSFPEEVCGEHAQTKAAIYILTKRVDAHDCDISTLKDKMQMYRQEVIDGMHTNHTDNLKIYQAIVSLALLLIAALVSAVLSRIVGFW